MCVAANARARGLRRAGAIVLLPLVGLLVALAFSATVPSMLAAPLQTSTPTLAPNTGAIVGLAWSDADGSGIQDQGELPLAGMTLSLANAGGQWLATAVTAADGSYRFTPLPSAVYHLNAQPPAGYQMTTPDELDVFVSAGSFLALDFGARFVPSPTPTSTPIPRIDIDSAPFASCGATWQDNTEAGQNNVNSYACAPGWDESGPELAYRIELGRSQQLTAVLVNSSVDLDLFLLPSAYPETCLAAGDNYLSHVVQPGIYFLVVDGFQGTSGDFALRLECPLGPQATATFTPTPSQTPTSTPSRTPGPSLTPTATAEPRSIYLPLVLRQHPVEIPAPAILTLQYGVDGYVGVADTTLSAWAPNDVFGQDAALRLRYNGQTTITTHMAPLLRFDLALLPVDANVVTATLRLNLVAPPDADLRAELHALLQSWDEGAASWQQRLPGQGWGLPGAQSIGVDYDAAIGDIQTIAPGGQWQSFDVRELVQAWVRDPGSNHGALVLAKPGVSQSNSEAGFASSNHATTSLHPQLSISYWLPAQQ